MWVLSSSLVFSFILFYRPAWWLLGMLAALLPWGLQMILLGTWTLGPGIFFWAMGLAAGLFHLLHQWIRVVEWMSILGMLTALGLSVLGFSVGMEDPLLALIVTRFVTVWSMCFVFVISGQKNKRKTTVVKLSRHYLWTMLLAWPIFWMMGRVSLLLPGFLPMIYIGHEVLQQAILASMPKKWASWLRLTVYVLILMAVFSQDYAIAIYALMCLCIGNYFVLKDIVRAIMKKLRSQK